jgi:hypothetical protein
MYRDRVHWAGPSTLCVDGSFGYVGITGVLSASVSDFMVWDGGLPFSGISFVCNHIV